MGALLRILGVFLVVASADAQRTLLILVDDVGVDAIGAYKEGSKPPPTPTIDALAKNGVLFRNAYANPICSPTRAALHTGRYCSRTGVGAVVSYGRGVPLSTAEHSLPEILGRRRLPVQTAMFGKWHLGDARNGGDKGPNLAGWSHFAGHMWNIKSPESYFSWRKVTNGTVSTSRVYATTDNVDDALAWIRAQEAKSNSWFCMLSFNAAHAPWHVPPKSLHTYNITNFSPVPLRFKAMVQAIDTELGRLFKSLGQGVMQQTNVVFVGDNGTPPAASEPPFTGAHAKTTLYEGGINVPLIVSGPAVVAPGREEAGLVTTVDLFATVLELNWIGPRYAVPRSIPLDGVSLLPYLKKTNKGSLRQTVFAERFGSQRNVAYRDGVAVRNQTYKLIRWVSPKKEAFFDLARDPFEKVNLLSRPLNATEKANHDALARELLRLRADALPYGDGCGIVAARARLELFRDGLPRVGRPFVTVIAEAAPPSPAAVLCTGLRQQSLDLGFLGMPGCRLLVTPDALSYVALQSRYGISVVSIPNQSALIGATAYQQAFVVTPGGGAQNLTATRGLRLRVGGQ